MLTEICNVLKNWFCSDKDKHIGTIRIEGGVPAPSFDLREGQYYRVIGSVFNDGVHKFGDASDVLTDEVFEGAVWEMRVPQAVLDIEQEMIKYQAEHPESPFTSESFGGYSYSKGSNSSGAPMSVMEVFGSRLNQWRKLL